MKTWYHIQLKSIDKQMCESANNNGINHNQAFHSMSHFLTKYETAAEKAKNKFATTSQLK